MLRPIRSIALLGWLSMACVCSAQTNSARAYPNEIRGYKVERTVVEVKKPDAKPQKGNNDKSGSNQSSQTTNAPADDTDVDSLIKLGKPQLASITPLGITFEVPIVVSPVKQSGHVDFLTFEEMEVNGTSVEIDEYHRSFNLPNKNPLTLREPLRFYVYLPRAMLAAIGEWSDSKETWQVTGRVYVFGKFKKSVLTFKRVVPVELSMTIANPLRRG